MARLESPVAMSASSATPSPSARKASFTIARITRSAIVAGSNRTTSAVMPGFSFKAGTDDLRESPMVELVERLLGKAREDLARSRAKLANDNFVRGAPAPVAVGAVMPPGRQRFSLFAERR